MFKKSGPPPAERLLADAQKLAKSQKKTVLVRYTASWCGWCRLLEKNLDEADVKPLIDRNYVIVTLDVMENGDKKALENPGADKLLAAMGGEKAGLPYFVFLEPGGKKLADSNALPGGQNLGCPASPEEIKAFGGLLKKTAPRLSAGEIQTILDRFAKNAPKQPNA